MEFRRLQVRLTSPEQALMSAGVQKVTGSIGKPQWNSL